MICKRKCYFPVNSQASYFKKVIQFKLINGGGIGTHSITSKKVPLTTNDAHAGAPLSCCVEMLRCYPAAIPPRCYMLSAGKHNSKSTRQ